MALMELNEFNQFITMKQFEPKVYTSFTKLEFMSGLPFRSFLYQNSKKNQTWLKDLKICSINSVITILARFFVLEEARKPVDAHSANC